MLIETLSEEIELSPERIRSRKIKHLLSVVWIVLFLSVSFGLLWYLLQPQQSFRVQGHLLSERVSFRHLEGQYDWGNNMLSAIHLYNFEKLTITGQRLQLDEQMDNSWERTIPLNLGSIHLQSDPDIPGIGINLQPVRIEHLPVAPGNLVSLTAPKQFGDPFKIHIEQEQSSPLYLNYVDSIEITAEQIKLKNQDEEEFIPGPAFLKVYSSEGYAGEITSTAYPGILALDVFLEDSFNIKSQGLLVGEPSFYKPVDHVAVPATLGGEILIQENNRPPLTKLTLRPGEAINIIGAKALSLDRLYLDDDGIFLDFQGEVSAIETGRNEELRNPSRIYWIWHNRKLLLISTLVIFSGLFVFVIVFLRS